MPVYKSGDPVFYNLPLYGTTLEGTPIYAEAFELGATGLSEDPYNSLTMGITSQNVETSGKKRQTAPQVAIPVSLPIVSTNTMTHNTRLISTVAPVSSAAYDTARKPLFHQLTDVDDNRSTPHTEERNSHTPVVSLLSIDNQLEKDYSSMQRGRRLRPASQSVPNHMPVYTTANGYLTSNPFVDLSRQQPHLSPFGGYHNGYTPGFTDYRRFIGYESKPNVGTTDGLRRYNIGKSHRSISRTDSNSSANCIDEKRDEKVMRTTVNSPPPAPYSPITNQYRGITNNQANKINNFRSKTNTERATSTLVAISKGSGSNPFTTDPLDDLTDSSVSSSSTAHLPIDPNKLNDRRYNPVANPNYIHPGFRGNRRLSRRNGDTGAGETTNAETNSGDVESDVAGVRRKVRSLML